MQLILDILQLAVEISENTKTDVFVNYAGHVDELGIMIFHGGWSGGRNADYKKDIYLDTNSRRTEEDITEALEEIYDKLRRKLK